MDKNLVESVLKNLKSWIKEWSTIEEKDLQFKRLTGITNRTYCVSHKKEDILPNKVLLRVFGGDVEDIFIDRSDELIVYQAAASNNLGPCIHGENKQMRAEQWIESRVLKQLEMNKPYYRRKVALLLNQFHQQKVQGIHEKPLPLKIFDDQVSIKAAKDKISEKSDIFNKEEIIKINDIQKYWLTDEEIQFMKKNLPKSEESIVFSHNDLLANNVLIDEKHKFFFIDFEYACYNYRSFDIANYFIESQFDYDVEQPPYFHLEQEMLNMDDIKDFVRYYALGSQLNLQEITLEQEDKLVQNEQYFKEQIKDQNKFDKEVEDIMKEIPLFMLFSNYFWGIWAIVMSKNPEIDFDYIEFSHARLKKYQLIKETYFGK